MNFLNFAKLFSHDRDGHVDIERVVYPVNCGSIKLITK